MAKKQTKSDEEIRQDIIQSIIDKYYSEDQEGVVQSALVELSIDELNSFKAAFKFSGHIERGPEMLMRDEINQVCEKIRETYEGLVSSNKGPFRRNWDFMKSNMTIQNKTFIGGYIAYVATLSVGLLAATSVGVGVAMLAAIGAGVVGAAVTFTAVKQLWKRSASNGLELMKNKDIFAAVDKVNDLIATKEKGKEKATDELQLEDGLEKDQQRRPLSRSVNVASGLESNRREEPKSMEEEREPLISQQEQSMKPSKLSKPKGRDEMYK